MIRKFSPQPQSNTVMTQEQQPVWHYTTLTKIKIIERDPILRPFGKDGQKPAVWFSKDQTWEPTAACNHLATLADGTEQFLDMKGLFQVTGGLYRFGVLPEDAPITWEVYRSLIDPDVGQVMVDGATRLRASPDNWRASLSPIEENKWKVVQMWTEESVWKTLNRRPE